MTTDTHNTTPDESCDQGRRHTSSLLFGCLMLELARPAINVFARRSMDRDTAKSHELFLKEEAEHRRNYIVSQNKQQQVSPEEADKLMRAPDAHSYTGLKLYGVQPLTADKADINSAYYGLIDLVLYQEYLTGKDRPFLRFQHDSQMQKDVELAKAQTLTNIYVALGARAAAENKAPGSVDYKDLAAAVVSLQVAQKYQLDGSAIYDKAFNLHRFRQASAQAQACLTLAAKTRDLSPKIIVEMTEVSRQNHELFVPEYFMGGAWAMEQAFKAHQAATIGHGVKRSGPAIKPT